jgi:hypothetical protein
MQCELILARQHAIARVPAREPTYLEVDDDQTTESPVIEEQVNTIPLVPISLLI